MEKHSYQATEKEPVWCATCEIIVHKALLVEDMIL